jgi:AcrR family transcriptional regulator
MSGSDPTPPRKKPRQERSRATVEVILEAAAHVLVSSGYEAATTKEIAERAGVSIGSLYQYFPSKEALVALLVERLYQRVLRVLADNLVAHSAADLEKGVREMVGALVEAYAVNPRLQKVLLEQSPRIGPLQVLRDVEARMELLVQNSLSRVREFEHSRNIGLVVFVLLRALRGAIWAALTERPELIGTPELVEELSLLVLGYLRPRSGPPATGG